ncbi:M20/M25/M40 family metallo-hydrolase [Mongoliitalea daihaiensis]|uniref:M20/M25/M40 family metallo-hydrolase n=1 Tax=Mongoliitalea daihaiensis TaxID=2782006 RepID=UPI001F37512B|nr:M20/M25/M40 family metallo-hydrolase [Mongoliitalea daihaiensis]UJP64688.1 M20/M25/M40 family metallo-hydrolase [Mongoliitalea daihaiensis]
MSKLYSAILIFLFLVSFSLQAQENLVQRLERHVQILAADSLEGRGLGTIGHAKAVAYLEQQMEEIGLQPFQNGSFIHEFPYKVQLVQVNGKNIVGMIPGSDPELSKEIIVVGAHYDHLGFEILPSGTQRNFPGADDNASGVAGMLEIARLVLTGNERPKRTLVFIAFDAEESGLIGADRFVKADKPFDNSAIKAMFSLDMIGMLGKAKGLELKGWETLADAKDLMARAQAREEITIKKMDASIEMRTDTWPFGKIGIPAIHVFTGLISPYHKPEDTPDLLDYEGMAKVTRFVTALTLEMANAANLSAIPSFAPEKVMGGKALQFGAKIGLGNSHNRHVQESFRANGVFAWEAGLYGSWNMTNNLQLVVSSLIDSNGSTTPYFEEDKLRRYSVTIPALIRLTTGPSEDGVGKAFVGAGAYFRHHLSQGLPEFAGIDIVGPAWEFPDQEWGLNLQFGFQVSKFTMTFDWRNALTQPFSLESRPDLEVYNRNFRVGLAYAFGK